MFKHLRGSFSVFPCYTKAEILLRQRVKDNFRFQELFLPSGRKAALWLECNKLWYNESRLPLVCIFHERVIQGNPGFWVMEQASLFILLQK